MHNPELLIDPAQQWLGSADSWQPLGVVDLDGCASDTRVTNLPPFPVVGIGNPLHAIANALDAVIEAPISLAAILAQVTRVPHAAAVAMQLLRNLQGLPIEQALALESMSYGLLQGSGEHIAWLATRPTVMTPVVPGSVSVTRCGSMLHIVLNRPQARNAIDRVMRDQLFEAFTLASLDSELRAITLRCVGNAFSMGGDLDEFGTTRDPATAHLIRSRSLPALALASVAAKLAVHVQGACVGAGLEIAAFAGRFTASADAWFQLPELSMGLIPGAGGCVSVPRRIGRQRAALMILSGRRINAATALRWGLIDEIKELPVIESV